MDRHPKLPHDAGTPHDHPGTRFRLFPQLPSLEQQGDPETVWVSPNAGHIGPGPSDDRMYVIDPIGKEQPYGYYPGPDGTSTHYKPPWKGPLLDPATPDEGGHFDHLELGSPQFEQAHAYGSIRFTVDIWEDYLGHPIEWHFEPEYDQLEILFLRGMDNAYAGYGSIEIGSYTTKEGDFVPFGLSFDVLSHEVGHLVTYSLINIPDGLELQDEYFGFRESAADMVSMITSLHFETALIGVLEASHGNLYTYNRLNRFGEVSDIGQLRLASNQKTMKDFTKGWVREHELAQPLTGAFFDIWVDIFHEILVERGLISPEIEALSDQLEWGPDYHNIMQPLFDEAYGKNPPGFAMALASARDYMGAALSHTWKHLEPQRLNYQEVLRVFTLVDEEFTGGRYRDIIAANKKRRFIGEFEVGPKLPKPPNAKSGHSHGGHTDKEHSEGEKDTLPKPQ